MSNIEIFYLIMLVIGFLPLTVYAYFIFRKAKLQSEKYKLFKIRDDLIYLIADGTLKEDDIVFREFYGMINTMIKHLDKFTFSAFISVSLNAKKDLEREESIRKIITALHESDEKVSNVVKEFFDTLMGIMVENSLMLKIVLRSRLFRNFIPRLCRSLRGEGISIYKKEHKLYDLYNEYKYIQERLGFRPTFS